MASANWEQSLAKIISRTNGNLQTMNSKYSGESLSTVDRSLGGGGGGGHEGGTTGAHDRWGQVRRSVGPRVGGGGFGDGHGQNHGQNHGHGQNQNLPPSSSDSKGFSSSKGSSSTSSASMGVDSSSLEAGILRQVQRMLDDKFVIVDRSVDSLRQQLASVASDVSRVSTEVSSLSRAVAAQEAVSESVRHDMNGRRPMLAKLESWVSDEDSWRSTADSRISLTVNDVKQMDIRVEALQTAVTNRASSTEMKLALDGAHLTATSAVASALGPIQTHLERELEGVRRHVAALRVGRSKDGIKDMSGEEVEQVRNGGRGKGLLLVASFVWELFCFVSDASFPFTCSGANLFPPFPSSLFLFYLFCLCLCLCLVLFSFSLPPPPK